MTIDGVAKTANGYFLQFRRLEVQDQDASSVGFLGKALLLVCKWPPFCYIFPRVGWGEPLSLFILF